MMTTMKGSKSVADIVLRRFSDEVSRPFELTETLDALGLDSLDVVDIEIGVDEDLGGFNLNSIDFWDREDPMQTTVADFIALAEQQVRSR